MEHQKKDIACQGDCVLAELEQHHSQTVGKVQSCQNIIVQRGWMFRMPSRVV